MQIHKLPKTALFTLLIITSLNLKAQRGIHGSVSISSSNVDVNTRTYLTSNVSAGATSVTVNSSSMTGAGFPGALTAGDLVLIIQMQGATINTGNSASFGNITAYNTAGNYEFRCVSSVPNSTTIQFSVPLSNAYTVAGHTQIVRIPRYTNLTVGSSRSISPATWNGNSGGVTAIEINGNLSLNGTITAGGKGFRGGAIDNNSQSASTIVTLWYSNVDADGGAKGEGIAGSEASEYQAGGYRYGRGAPANGGGGGNSHNAGGGGGANAGVPGNWNGKGNPDNSNANNILAWNIETASFSLNTSSGGGRGGYTYSANNSNATLIGPGNSAWGGNNRQNVGGYGGRPLDYSTGRIFMGGGGGAGDGNNGGSAAGGNGGGIVFIICYGNITGSGKIESNGANGSNTTGTHNDAPGGGGGGGTIIVANNGSFANTISLEAKGGDGGNQFITSNEAEGPGGGGGGGYIAISSGSPSKVVTGGVNGTTTSTAVTEFTPNGATSGGAGTGNATFNLSTISASFTANAGPDLNFCNSAILGASLQPGTRGVWSVIVGTGGTFNNLSLPNAVFVGDSSQNYTLVWTVNNPFCDVKRDTVLLNPICMPLPIKLISFNGEYTEAGINLHWISAEKQNFREFILERQNSDGVWKNIATVQSGHLSIEEYNYTDKTPFVGTVNFRLKMVDNDNSFRYSQEISFSSSENPYRINIYPVPAGREIKLEGANLEKSEIRIFSSLGQTFTLNQEFNDHTLTIDLSELPEGYYFIQIIRNQKIELTKPFYKSGN